MPRGYAAPDPYEYSGQLRECTKCGRHQPLAAPHWSRMNDGRRIPWDAWCRKCVDENGK
jgi:hypothetical protein